MVYFKEQQQTGRKPELDSDKALNPPRRCFALHSSHSTKHPPKETGVIARMTVGANETSDPMRDFMPWIELRPAKLMVYFREQQRSGRKPELDSDKALNSPRRCFALHSLHSTKPPQKETGVIATMTVVANETSDPKRDFMPWIELRHATLMVYLESSNRPKENQSWILIEH